MSKPHSAIQMKSTWDQLAAVNAEHFIESSSDIWDLEDFRRSGRDDVERLLLPQLTKHRLDPSRLSVLDFGCGIGRLSQALSHHFRSVTAVDVSDLMISKGKNLFKDLSNIEWVSYDGHDLSRIKSQSHDVIFSYIVLHHIPEESLALHYIEEMCRILAPGGLLHVHFSHRSFYRARRLYCQVRATLARNDFVYRYLLNTWNKRRYGREELINMLLIMQHSLHPARVKGVVEKAGLGSIELDTRIPTYSWITARRPTA